MDQVDSVGGAAPALAAHSKDASTPGPTPASSAKPTPPPNGDANDMMRSIGNATCEYGERAARQASEFVREQPLLAMAVTGLTGILIGLLFSRR